MISTRMRAALGLAVVIAFASTNAAPSFAGSAKSQIVNRELQLKNFMHNKILFTQTGSSTRDGVYTADQAQQGKAIYGKQCAMCHGAALLGVGQIAPLAGDDFMANWTGKTLADLYANIQTTMPTSQPGSLKPEETVQILAYILSTNTFPTGRAELPKVFDSLKAIHIDKPKPKP